MKIIITFIFLVVTANANADIACISDKHGSIYGAEPIKYAGYFQHSKDITRLKLTDTGEIFLKGEKTPSTKISDGYYALHQYDEFPPNSSTVLFYENKAVYTYTVVVPEYTWVVAIMFNCIK